MTYKLFISILFLFFYSHCFGNSINELTTRANQGHVDAQVTIKKYFLKNSMYYYT